TGRIQDLSGRYSQGNPDATRLNGLQERFRYSGKQEKDRIDRRLFQRLKERVASLRHKAVGINDNAKLPCARARLHPEGVFDLPDLLYQDPTRLRFRYNQVIIRMRFR